MFNTIYIQLGKKTEESILTILKDIKSFRLLEGQPNRFISIGYTSN
jgi:hypothetical protein